LFNGQTASNQQDIVCRVFRMKLHAMIDEIVNNHVLGTVLVYTTEF